MTRSDIDQGRATGQRSLPPERWEIIKSEAGERAHMMARFLREFGGWIASLPLAHLRRLRAWRTRRAAVRELQGLDNRILRDMGIARSEIEYLVSGGDAERRRPKVPPAASASKTIRNCDVMSDRQAA